MARTFRGMGVVGGLAVMALALAQPGPTGAEPQPGSPPSGAPRSGANTELTLTGVNFGQSVQGFLADSFAAFNPTKGYPANDPTTGFTVEDAGFAGLIRGTPKGGGPDLLLYCVDLRTDTYVGIGYELASWADAKNPYVGYGARILNEFYPSTGEPASLAPNARAAAVQAAIWYFSDGYVVKKTDPVHDAVAKIVNQVLAEGPLTQPPPPSLSVSPPTASGPPGSVVGPFTVTSSATTTVTATDALMFADAGATVPIANGATVTSGQRIWLKSTGALAAMLEATATATVPSGNVYLYDGDSGLTAAQKLILARAATLRTTVSATALFDKDLVIDKRADQPTVTAGGRASYQITVRNRGRGSARDFRVCDHIPSPMAFARADRKLRRFGRQRCLVIRRLRPGERASFHIALHVDADAAGRTVSNVADIKPGVEEPESAPAPIVDVPGAPAELADVVIKRDRAIVRVKARRAAGPRAPVFTG